MSEEGDCNIMHRVNLFATLIKNIVSKCTEKTILKSQVKSRLLLSSHKAKNCPFQVITLCVCVCVCVCVWEGEGVGGSVM